MTTGSGAGRDCRSASSVRRRARAGEEGGAQWAECGSIGAGTRRGSKPGEAGFPVGCDERTGRTGKQRVR